MTRPRVSRLLTVLAPLAMLPGGAPWRRVFSALCGLLVLLAGLPAQAEAPLTRTSIQLNWMYQFEFAGPVAALEKGFYREAGLAVELHEGGPKVDPITPVANGEIDFGIAGSSLVVDRYRGMPVVALASLMQHSAVGLLARRSAGIDSVLDLKGKRLAITFDTAAEIDAYLKSQGIGAEDYQRIDRFVPVDGLDAGEADAIAVYVSNELFHTRHRVDDYILLTPRSSGIDLFGNILFARAALVRERPELVEAFRKATIRGWDYALAHPQEIAELLLQKYNSQNKTLEHLLFEAERLRELTRPDIVEPGYMSAGRWRHVADVYAEQGKLPANYDLGDFIYDPDPKVDYTWLYLTLAGSLLALLVTLGIAMYFRRMNRRLLAANGEARSAQQALEQSEQRFRRLFDYSPDPVWIIDEHLYVDCNQAALDILGYASKAEVQYLHPATLSPVTQADGENSFDKAERQMRLVEATGLLRFEWMHLRRDGSSFLAEVTLSAIKLQGRPVIHCLWRDITERKRAETALKESEANYRELVDNVNAIILRVAPDGTITYFNEFAERFFGYRADEIQGRHVIGTIVPETESTSGRDMSALIADIVANPTQYANCENENTTRDGRRVMVRWANQVILDEQGKPSGVLSIGTDVTAQKQAEALMIQAKEAAESASLAKSRFLATMSHEIRTPMNGILGMAQMLLMEGLSEPARRDYARTILNSGQTLLTLLNDILDFSKVEAGKLELYPAVVDPAQILQETAKLFRENAAEKGLRLNVGWAGAADSEPSAYLADPNRLRQMLSNLTNNAIKFTEVGEVSISGREVERDDKVALLEFSVADTGIGIDPDKQALLFKPFSQADSTINRQFGGTGLGLSIIRSLAQKMGGDVGVESRPGAGARFWFRIRAELAAADADRRSAPRLDAETPSPVARLGGSVLVVEDNLTNQKVIQALLNKLGLSSRVAADGLAAVQAVEQDPAIDLILMDIQMPVMNGYEATQAIRAREAELGLPRRPVIALTANAFDEDRQNCLDAGMDDFLAKPLSLDKLTQALQRWLPDRLPVDR